MAWSPFHISLFNTCNSNLFSSPLFRRYDSSKSVSLMTDWSTNGMNYILIQPDISSDSLKALRTIEESGNCSFELILAGPSLRPILFVSWSILPYEMNHHSFAGESTCSRWSIARNRRYLWDKPFYRICDYNSMK